MIGPKGWSAPNLQAAIGDSASPIKIRQRAAIPDAAGRVTIHEDESNSSPPVSRRRRGRPPTETPRVKSEMMADFETGKLTLEIVERDAEEHERPVSGIQRHLQEGSRLGKSRIVENSILDKRQLATVI